MFRSFGVKSKKSLRRGRKIGRRRGPVKRSRMGGNNYELYIKIGGIVFAAAALVVLIVFVFVPLFSGKKHPGSASSLKPSASVTQTPLASLTVDELTGMQKTVTDPYIYKNGDVNELIYSTGDTASSPDKIYIYDIKTKQDKNVDGITKKNDGGLFEPKINDKYIVYLDCKSKDGGSVCGYDIASKKSFVIRDYVFGKPKVTLSGKYALWLQQTNVSAQNAGATDKLYLYDMEKQEAATIEVFTNVSKIFISAPYMSGDSIIYMQPKGESQILGTAATTDVQMCIIPLSDKGDTQRILGSTGTFIYEPQIQGNNIVYMDGVRSKDCNLMYCTVSPSASKVDPTTLGNNAYDDSKNLTPPVKIIQGAVNYCIGDGFVAYTLNDAVYAYYFADGSTRKISADKTKALLCNVSGKDVIWYDTTDSTGGDVPDAVMHVMLP